MAQINHYQVLGVAPGAGTAEITAAYNRGLSALREKISRGEAPSPTLLDELRAAWKVLGDAAARAAYDSTLAPPPAPPAARIMAATLPAAPTQRLPFEFTGSGPEYFRIWIVNLLLSILTLGIYSAWAKVRREQYFHRNLQFGDASFAYHGEARAILKGRAIAFSLLIVLSIAENFGPVVYWAALLVIAPAMPWLMVRALRFRAHNTSYRGLRFSFVGQYRQAAVVFLGFGLLTLVTLGLALPLFIQRMRRFTLDNLRYGAAPFSCSATAGQFYRIYVSPILIGAALFGTIFLVAKIGSHALVGLPVLVLAAIALFFLVGPYLKVRSTNVVWNATKVASGQFESTMTLRGYLGVVAVNILMLVLTLGFFWPWAAVRLARYRAQCMALALPGSLDDFLAGETAGASALGDEVAEMFDVDIGA